MIEERGLTIAQVARELEVKRQVVSRIAAKGTPRATTANNLAEAISRLCPERPVTRDDVLACGKAQT